MTQYLTNSPELKKYRQDLRNNLTNAEVTLWKYLKSKQLEGRKFRRQFSVGNYILDFYCVEENLAIELDGQEHYSEAGYESDLRRSDFLREQGIRVLRFENEDVFKNTEEVLKKSKSILKMIHPANSVASPLLGETQRGIVNSTILYLNEIPPCIPPIRGKATRATSTKNETT